MGVVTNDVCGATGAFYARLWTRLTGAKAELKLGQQAKVMTKRL